MSLNDKRRKSGSDHSRDEREQDLHQFTRLACSLGASAATIICPDDIQVEDRLADLCNPSQCEDYGLAPGCPPHVPGPAGFREMQKNARYALAVRISVPAATLLGDEGREIMKSLHKVVAGCEQAAVEAGYHGSKGFAGGSCKDLFCDEQEDCRVLSTGSECCYPKSARPSMSGFGVNVLELMKACGWPADIASHEASKDPDKLSWVAGLILIGPAA